MTAFVQAPKFCARCNQVTTWVDYLAPGTGMLACANVRPDETGRCGMTTTTVLTDEEQLNLTRYFAPSGPSPRPYSWT